MNSETRFYKGYTNPSRFKVILLVQNQFKIDFEKSTI